MPEMRGTMTTGAEKITYSIKKGHPLPMGLTREADGINVSVQVPETEAAELILYKTGNGGKRKESLRIPFPEEGRLGKILCMKVEGLPDEFAYNFRVGGEICTDIYAKYLPEREHFGAPWKETCALCYQDDFDWEGDRTLNLPLEDTILYRLHVRGFTKHISSMVQARGTFAGIKEKIPYLKELGITMIELLPAYEFDEIHRPLPENVMKEQDGRTNYWGYTNAFYFAPKAAYSQSGKAYTELKELVRELHKNGIEICMEFYFVPGTRKDFVTECLRYWLQEYHIDGFHINSDVAPMQMIAEDPLLATTKLFGAWWGGNDTAWKGKKHLAEFHDGFMMDGRRFLKGDEGQLQTLSYRMLANPEGVGIVNYMANHDSLTLWDSVTYERKRNEKNGENNRDGSAYNHSWNCGEEGESRRKKVLERRDRQMRNALSLVFLSQGIPMLLAGDELGRTKGGNNNAWCQDNETSWINWKLNTRRSELLRFVIELIKFRKEHRIFHMPKQLKSMDYGKNGYPDVSCHGTRAWYPDYEAYNRHIGMMFCGEYTRYVQEKEEDFYYVAWNSHWEQHMLALPNLPKGKCWYELMSTDKVGDEFQKEAKLLDNQKEFIAVPRSCTILVGREKNR